MSASLDLRDFETRLSGIDWKRLSHAYGSARDLPALLMAVARGEDDGGDLFANIYHQGTVYSATAAAAPFLAELALAFVQQPDATRACTDVTLLTLLGHIASGAGYYQAHGQLSWEADRATPRVLAREKREVTNAHLAVCQAWPRLAVLLAHPGEAVRMEAIILAGQLYGIGATAWEQLQALLAVERDALCRGAAWWSLQRLLHGTRHMAAYSDRAAWPAPFAPDRMHDLQQALMAQLGGVAADPGAPAEERWIAVELRVQGGGSPVLDAQALGALSITAIPSLEGHWYWDEGYPWLQDDPVLRLDVLSHRLRSPELPLAGLVDGARVWHELAHQHRSLRPRSVAELVALLGHAAPEARLAAAEHLHACGLACRPHVPALWQAGEDDAALRTWLLAPLRACGEVAGTTPWIAQALQACSAAWSDTANDQAWTRSDDEKRLLRALAQVVEADAGEVAPVLQQGLQRWLDSRVPLTTSHDGAPMSLNLPTQTLDRLDKMDALPPALLTQALAHGLPLALRILARRAGRAVGQEGEALAAQVRLYADDARMQAHLRRRALLEIGDDAARQASLAGLRGATLHNTSWDEACWWTTQADGVPKDLLAHWRGFLVEADAAGPVFAAECLWLATKVVDERMLDRLLLPDPHVQALKRIALLREMQPALGEPGRERLRGVLRQWLAQPQALQHLDVARDAQWLQAVQDALVEAEAPAGRG